MYEFWLTFFNRVPIETQLFSNFKYSFEIVDALDEKIDGAEVAISDISLSSGGGAEISFLFPWLRPNLRTILGIFRSSLDIRSLNPLSKMETGSIICVPSWALQFPIGTKIRLIGK